MSSQNGPGVWAKGELVLRVLNPRVVDWVGGLVKLGVVGVLRSQSACGVAGSQSDLILISRADK